MSRTIALHQITAIEATPVELVKIASAVGCDEVGVFVHLPPFLVPGSPMPKFEFEVVGQSHKRDLLDHMRDLNVKIANLEFFGIHPDFGTEEYRGPLELGGELGARGATVWIQDSDDARVIDNLGRFCETAANFNLIVGIEFVGLLPYCNSIARAVHFVDQIARPNLAVAIDMLGMIRTGGTVADIEALPPKYFAYVQLSDGYGTHTSSTYFKEAMDRLMPGEGDWPLRELMAVLPADLPLDVEVPSRVAKAAGMPALERARWAVSTTRRLLDEVTPIRRTPADAAGLNERRARCSDS